MVALVRSDAIHLLSDPVRLALLAKCRILDTGYEEAFDDIVSLAAMVCGVPVAAIAFMDAKRQWLKAEKGLGIREIAIQHSVCRHAILEMSPFSDFFVIPDLKTDVRTLQSPMVSTEGYELRFYAGVMIKLGGHLLGTLCVMDREPRDLNEQQFEALVMLRDQIVRELERRVVNEHYSPDTVTCMAIAELESGQGKHFLL
jgi:GAF domain-containing protein